jgi:hypothetical protein
MAETFGQMVEKSGEYKLILNIMGYLTKWLIHLMAR